MAKKKIIIGITEFLITVLVLFAALWRVNYVLRDKTLTSMHDNFKAYKAKDVDIIFVGQSHCFCSISTDILYSEYGIESFMLASSAQTVPMSYYAAMEAIELKHPEKIVFEVAYIPNTFTMVSDGMTHAFFDGMPRCHARREAMQTLLAPGERLNYLIPLGTYHSRWKDLHESDFTGNITSARGSFHTTEVDNVPAFPIVNASEKAPIPDMCLEYLDKMVDLCESTGTELILFAAPFGPVYYGEENFEGLKDRERIFNSLADYATARGIRYYNLFNEFDNLGLEESKDWMDNQHLNCNGQLKLTRYMADNGYFD